MTVQVENKHPIIDTIKNGLREITMGCLMLPLALVLSLVGAKIAQEGFENLDDGNLERPN